MTNIHRQRVSEVLNAILKKYLGIEVAAVAAHYILISSSSDISNTLLLPTSQPISLLSPLNTSPNLCLTSHRSCTLCLRKLLTLGDTRNLTSHVVLALDHLDREAGHRPPIERAHAGLGANRHQLRLAILGRVDSLGGHGGDASVAEHVVSEVSAEDGDRVVQVQHAALVNFGDVADGVHARAGGIDAQRAGVGVDPAVGFLKSFRHEGGARRDADGGNVDVGGQGLAGAEVDFGLAVGALGVFVDLSVVEYCDADGGELALGLFGERLAESWEEFVAGCDECDASLATEFGADFAGGFDCNGAAATDDDVACRGEACVHFLESLDGDVVVTVQGSARGG